MRDAIDTLEALEQDLLAALDREDTAAVAELVAARGEALEALRRAFEASDEAARRQVRPDLQRLAAGDAVLGARCARLRDQLQDRLQQAPRPVPGSQHAVMSGVVDRQA